MKPLRRHSGFTLIETLAAVAAMAFIMLTIVKLTPKIFTFFTTMQVRQQANAEGRRCLTTIEHWMLEGRADTLVISSPASSPIPNSSIQFVGLDGRSYTIAWSSSPMNTAHLLRSNPSSGVLTDTVLARHVSSLQFIIPDSRDPSLVKVSLVIKVPLNASGSPESFYTLYIPEELIQMASS